MNFQEQLAALIPEDKKGDAQAIFDAMTTTFQRYDTDIKTLKEQVRAKTEFSREDYVALQTAHEKLTEEHTALSGNYKTLEKSAKTTGDELGVVKKALASNAIEKEVLKALSSFEFVEGAQADVFRLIAPAMTYKPDGSVVAATVDKDGKPIEVDAGAYVKAWTENSPIAKHVLVAKDSSGSGAGHGSGGSGGSTARARYDAIVAKQDKGDALSRREELELIELSAQLAAEDKQ